MRLVRASSPGARLRLSHLVCRCVLIFIVAEHPAVLLHGVFVGPVLDGIDGLPGSAWTDIGMGEDATLMRHRPAGWAAEQSYVVVRRCREGRQRS